MKSAKRRKLEPLTNEQIEELAEILCDEGAEERDRLDALVVLTDEITKQPHPHCTDVAEMVKRVAFNYSLSGDEARDAHAELLRSEVGR